MSKIEELIAKLCADGVEYRKLGDLAQLSNNGVDKKIIPGETEVSLLNYMDICRNKKIAYENLSAITTSTDKKMADCNLLKGDVFITPSSETRDDLANAAEIIADIPNAVYSYHVMRIRLKNFDLMNPTFIVHLFASEYVQTQIIRLSTGITRYGLTKPKWESLSFPVPPLKVQEEIVEILDEFEELKEELRAELEAELAARKAQKTYVLNEFQKGNSPKQNSSKLMTLKDVVYFENGKPQEKLVQSDGDCSLITSKFISTNGVRARRINYSNTLTPALKGDIAIVLSDLPNGRALARCFFVDGDKKYAVNQRIAILRSLNIEIADPEYLFHYVNRNPQVLRYDNGSTQTNLKKADVMNISIHLPDIKTQREIAQELTTLELFVNEISFALPAEINSRNQQFDLYRNKLLTFKELRLT